jgi:hypothetical protein
MKYSSVDLESKLDQIYKGGVGSKFGLDDLTSVDEASEGGYS